METKILKPTSEHWWEIINEKCLPIFLAKAKDYGTAWRILRLPSLTDQIYIKISRLRSIEEKSVQKVEDSIIDEYIGAINYCIIALVQLSLPLDAPQNIPYEDLESLYREQATIVHNLMMDKNYDYGEAWRNMRISSLTDLMLTKCFRIKKIEDHQGKTLVSEDVAANYHDIINYCVFSLIKMSQ